MQNKEIILHLSLIDDISSATIVSIIHNKPEACELADLYTMSAHDLQHYFGLPPQRAQKIVSGLTSTKLLAEELALIAEHGVEWVTFQCHNYPALLKSIHLFPPVLYFQGTDPSTINSAIAFVGSRDANTYGQYVIDQLVPPILAHGYAIISGGAQGADAMAHQACLNAGGRTVAILGSGLLRPYPAANKKLFQKIAAASGSAMVSAFPLRMDGLPHNFPARNRIIAGLSQGTVVVQAAARSGALITAKFALDQGRDVFAVPGPIYDPISAGCHALISQGAKLVAHPNDILREYGHEIPEPESEKTSKSRGAKKVVQSQATEKQISLIPATLDDSPRGRILTACARPCSTDELSQLTNLSLTELPSLLFELQFEGAISQNFAGLWERQ